MKSGIEEDEGSVCFSLHLADFHVFNVLGVSDACTPCEADPSQTQMSEYDLVEVGIDVTH